MEYFFTLQMFNVQFIFKLNNNNNNNNNNNSFQVSTFLT